MDESKKEKMYHELVNEIKEKSDINIPDERVYVVKSGDTLLKIANEYNITVDEIKKTNHLTSDMIYIDQILMIPFSNPVILPTSMNYTVMPGDTLIAISRKFSLPVDILTSFNALNSNLIMIGQVLKIPISNAIHIVKQGDTLWSLANKYSTTVDELKRINGLTDDILMVGRILKIA